MKVRLFGGFFSNREERRNVKLRDKRAVSPNIAERGQLIPHEMFLYTKMDILLKSEDCNIFS